MCADNSIRSQFPGSGSICRQEDFHVPQVATPYTEPTAMNRKVLSSTEKSAPIRRLKEFANGN